MADFVNQGKGVAYYIPAIKPEVTPQIDAKSRKGNNGELKCPGPEPAKPGEKLFIKVIEGMEKQHHSIPGEGNNQHCIVPNRRPVV